MKKLTIFTFLLILGISLLAQESKRPLTFDDILKWNRITEKMISHDGQTIVYKAEPWKGDTKLYIKNNSGQELISIDCGSKAEITNDSKYVIFTINPKEETLRDLKLKKTITSYLRKK